MIDYRRKLWLNIIEDLGPPEGCIVPFWLRLVYTLLFPLHGLKCFIDDALGFDCLRMVWRIHGVDYSDRLFARIAVSSGGLYRFTRVNGLVTIEQLPETL